MSPIDANAGLALEHVADPATALPEWTALARRSDNVFATPEWLLTWWRHRGRGELALWRAGDGAGARAILPLHLHEGTLRFLGRPEGDQLGPVCAPEDRADAARALRALLEGGAIPWEVFAGDDLPGDVEWEVLLDAERTRETPCPLVRLPDTTWDEFLSRRSRNFRAQVGKRERRLARAGSLRYRATARPDELDRDLDAFLALHRARWGGPTRSFDGLKALHRDLVGVMLERGWLRLRFLELDGQPIAALYNLRFAEAESSYQAGRDPAYDRYAPGFVLHAHAIREALEDGLSSYRLLRGGESYKGRFADGDAGLVSVRREA